MSPTCSSRFFTGRNTRSDAALTTTELLPRENYPRSPENTYAMGSLWHADRVRQREPFEVRTCAPKRISVVCSARFEALERCHAMPSRDRRMRWRGAPGRERAGGELPGRRRGGEVPREPEAREELRPRRDRAQCR